MNPKKNCFTELNQVSAQGLGNFSYLQSQVANWQKLTPLIQSLLPPEGQWQVVCFQNRVLTITGDNQALISQVRYLHQQFINKLKDIPALAELEKLNVILRPQTQTTPKKYTANKPLSKQTQQELQMAARLVSDAKLSQALLDLASPVNRKDDEL